MHLLNGVTISSLFVLAFVVSLHASIMVLNCISLVEFLGSAPLKMMLKFTVNYGNEQQPRSAQNK